MGEIINASEAMEQMYNQTDDIYYIENGGLDVEAYEALKLSKDLKTTIKNISSISKDEIKTLVDLFYKIQKIRISMREQIRSIESGLSSKGENGSANVAILNFILTNVTVLEKNISNTLILVVESQPEGRWLINTVGIGPILAAGLMGHLDISGKEYATQFISFAGLNDNNRPWLGREKSKKIIEEIVGNSKEITDDMVSEIAVKTQWNYNYLLSRAYKVSPKTGKAKWSKADLIKACSVIPYSKDLKTLMYKVGCSFQWNCNNSDSLYGRLFSERRVQELAKNENGDFADQAAKILETKNIGKETEAYKAYSQGKLPKAHINMRAMRWAEKIFLSHLFEEMYRVHNDAIPPRYYALEHCDGKHNKLIEPEVPFDKVSSELQ